MRFPTQYEPTYQQILWAINDAALLAAQSAVDAFGSEVPSAEIAWDFINEQVYGESVDRPAALPEVMTRQFEHDYRRQVRNVLSGNPFATVEVLL